MSRGVAADGPMKAVADRSTTSPALALHDQPALQHQALGRALRGSRAFQPIPPRLAALSPGQAARWFAGVTLRSASLCAARAPCRAVRAGSRKVPIWGAILLRLSAAPSRPRGNRSGIFGRAARPRGSTRRTSGRASAPLLKPHLSCSSMGGQKTKKNFLEPVAVRRSAEALKEPLYPDGRETTGLLL